MYVKQVCNFIPFMGLAEKSAKLEEIGKKLNWNTWKAHENLNFRRKGERNLIKSGLYIERYSYLIFKQ